MSYYDDASIMFIGGAATGVDGKAGTAKPINGGSPLYVTRGSNLTATRVDSNGLIEKGRENSIAYSNEFVNWSNDDTTDTSGQEGYDGTNDAWKLVGNTNASRHMIFRSVSFSGVGTFSLYVKASGHNYVQIASAQTTGEYANFDLSDGSIGNVGDRFIDAKTTSVGNGWYRLSVVTTNGANTFYIALVSSKTAAWLESWTMGNATDGILFQDAQLEGGLVATEYIESGASKGKAGILDNEPRFNYPIGGSIPHLLLEPQRTNVIETSEYFEGSYWGIGGSATRQLRTSITAPDGSNAVYLLSGGGEDTSDRLQNNLGDITANGNHIFSVFVKGTGVATQFRLRNNSGAVENVVYDIDSSGNFTLNSQNATDNYYGAEDYGNGWHRVYLKITPAAGDNYFQIFPDILDANGSVYIWGAQACASEYITSYIPNHSGGLISRESESVTTASVPSLINQNEGVFFVDFEFLDGQTAENQNWIALESENGAEKVLIYKASANNSLRYYLSANGSAYISGSTIGVSPNTRYKVAVKYSDGDFAIYINGAKHRQENVTFTRGSDLSRVTFNESLIQSSCRVHELITFQSGWDNVDLEILTGVTGYESFAAMAATLNYTVYE